MPSKTCGTFANFHVDCLHTHVTPNSIPNLFSGTQHALLSWIAPRHHFPHMCYSISGIIPVRCCKKVGKHLLTCIQVKRKLCFLFSSDIKHNKKSIEWLKIWINCAPYHREKLSYNWTLRAQKKRKNCRGRNNLPNRLKKTNLKQKS